jgi:hypothetical protein
MRWSEIGNIYIANPRVVTWETQWAKFLHIEISPSHILRVKIDKHNKKKGVD